MNPIVHAELSWLGAQKLFDRRDRMLVTLAGVLPDLDGLTLLGGEELYGKWHHVLTHGALSAVELFSSKADAKVVATLRKRFSLSPEGGEGRGEG